MGTLLLGLVAALCWGIHDICVRFVSQRTSIYSALLTVLVAGSAFQMIAMALQDGFEPISPHALGLSASAGIFFTIASIGLYKAFSVGPVRLVSPIIASYPVLSVGWATLSGTPVTALQWGAVIVIIAGVSIVAILSDLDHSHDHTHQRNVTIAWAICSGIGFAGTFALGQSAARVAPDLPVILLTRLAAIAILLFVMLALKTPLLPTRKQVPLLATMGALDAVALVCVLTAGGLPHAEYAAVAASTFGVVTILLAWGFLGEAMTKLQWGGVTLAFAGIGYLAL